MAASLYSVFIYMLTLFLMLVFNALSIAGSCNRLQRVPRSNIPILAIIIFSIVFGVRYNVGIDHLSYLEMYQTYRYGRFELDTEWGFAAVIKLFSWLECHFSIFFFALAFLELYLVFYALKKYPKQHALILIVFFLLTHFLNFMNGIRQELAFCFWMVAIQSLSYKRFWHYILFLGLGVLFHFSAIILFPIYLLYTVKDSYFNNVKVQLIITFCAIVVSLVLKPTEIIFGLVAEIAKMMGYYGYVGMVIEGNTEFLEASRGLGLGYLVIMSFNAINIYLSKNVKQYFNDRQYNIMYDLYFFGVIYMYLTNGSIALQRINYYFYNFNFVIGAFTLYYLLKHKTKKNLLLFCVLIFLYVLFFSAIIVFRGAESCAIYNTFWSI